MVVMRRLEIFMGVRLEPGLIGRILQTNGKATVTVARRQETDVHLGLGSWTTNITPVGSAAKGFKKGARGGVVAKQR